MVNEHSTNPEPQGSDHSAPDDVATNSISESDSTVESGPESTHGELENPSDSQEDSETASPSAESSEDGSASEASDGAFQDDFGDVFAGVVQTSADEEEPVTDVAAEVSDTTEPEPLPDEEQATAAEPSSIDTSTSEEEVSTPQTEHEGGEPDAANTEDTTLENPDEVDDEDEEIDIDPNTDTEFVAVSHQEIAPDIVDETEEISATETVIDETEDIAEAETVVDETEEDSEPETVVDETEEDSEPNAVVDETEEDSEPEAVVDDAEDTLEHEAVVDETEEDSDPETAKDDAEDLAEPEVTVDETEDVVESETVVATVEDCEDGTSAEENTAENAVSNAPVDDGSDDSSDDAQEPDASSDAPEEDEPLDESATLDSDDDWDDDDWDEEEQETMANADHNPPVEPDDTSTEESNVEEPEPTPVASESEAPAAPSSDQETQPPTSPPATPNVAPSPTTAPKASSSGTTDAPSTWQKIQPILTATIAILLTTLIQWLNLGQGALEAVQANNAKESEESSGVSILTTVWNVAQPILVTVLLFSSRTLTSGMGWVLAKVDADASASVKDGTAPTLPERIQSLPAGDKIWDVLETIWKLWTGLLGFLRDRIFPESIRHWSNQAITAIVAFVIVFVLWVSSSLSPSPAQEVASSNGATPTVTDIAPISERPAPAKKANPSKDKNLAASIQEQLTEELSFRYSDDLIQDVAVDRQRDLLTVTIGQEWYDLGDRQQQRLAKTILSNTEDTPFTHLTLVNLDGVRIARNPVVGSDMILFDTIPPVIEEPVIEEPIIEEPIIEEPVVEESIVEDTAEIKADVSESTDTQATDSSEGNEDGDVANTPESETTIETPNPSPFSQDLIEDGSLVFE